MISRVGNSGSRPLRSQLQITPHLILTHRSTTTTENSNIASNNCNIQSSSNYSKPLITMSTGSDWKYLPLLNVCIKIVLNVLLGMILSCLQVVDARSFVPQATKFVFYLALPMLVFQGLGIEIDFYNDQYIWRFIGAFLLLRLIALAVALVMAIYTRPNTTNGSTSITGHCNSYTTIPGQVAVYWLALTWISTIILGVPICGAVFGQPQLGKVYGILAGISSFIFQLPLQLMLLEYHSILQDEHQHGSQDRQINDEPRKVTDANNLAKQAVDNEAATEAMEYGFATKTEGGDTVGDDVPLQGLPPKESAIYTPSVPTNTKVTTDQGQPCNHSHRGQIMKRVLTRLSCNPVLWAIAAGFVMSISTLGPEYLSESSDNTVTGLAWISDTANWFGACVSPLALFSMGVWMQSQGRAIFCLSIPQAVSWMTARLVLVPLVMLGLAKAVNLDDQSGRAAVLISALPISLASFSLASKYKTGEGVLAANVALGTVFILPTVLLWNLVLDAFDVFPLDD
jgi:predicted permease